MKWIKFDDSMTNNFFKNLGCFLGRYEEVHPRFFGSNEMIVTGIRYYYSHLSSEEKPHIQSYPPLMPCPEININTLKLTHYMILDEPND